MVCVYMLLMLVFALGRSSYQVHALAKPTLTLDPPGGVVLLGEEFSLTCHFPLTHCNVELYINKESQYIDHSSESDYSATFKIDEDGTRTLKGRTNYTCQYTKYFENNRTWAYSPRSEPVCLTVTDTLPKPTMSVDPPSGVVTVGEGIQITCITSYPAHRSGLYRGHSDIIDTRHVSGSEGSVTFPITDLEPTDGGAYICVFEKTVKGRVYLSPLSDPVQVTVTDTLPRAGISIDPESGVVGRGKPFHITCTSPVLLRSGGRFVLYRDGAENPTEAQDVSGSDRSASFPLTGTNQTQNYTCAYGRMVKERVYLSPRSDTLQVKVTGTSTENALSRKQVWLSAGCVVAILVFLLLGLACFIFYKKHAAVSRTDHTDPGPAEREVVYACLRADPLSRGAVGANPQGPSRPAHLDTCVYAEMRVR
uniref:osteoclast-associated immunoglobulin-like receptor isoform X2 n=1 Tax=Pristiophorus japonicus TaxID=55135 RepID=UPI00398EFA2B